MAVPHIYQTNGQSGNHPFGGCAVSVKDAAALYGVDQSTIRDAINKQHLAAKRVGRKILIGTDALAAWFDALDDARDAS